ncbi:hypothetical protein KPATCC21470_8623 [Kitasatospora purpeofusca]
MLVTLPLIPNNASPADTMFERLVCCVRGRNTTDSDDHLLLGTWILRCPLSHSW